MSELIDRITEVLRKHVISVRAISNVNDNTYFRCRCGKSPFTDAGHAAHVAERIEAELGLAEEALTERIAAIPGLVFQRFLDYDGAFSTKIHDEREVAERVARAWVSAWSEVEP